MKIIHPFGILYSTVSSSRIIPIDRKFLFDTGVEQ